MGSQRCLWLVLALFLLPESHGWVAHRSCKRSSRLFGLDLDSLMDMDVVTFSRPSSPSLVEVGAVQEDGSLAPLSVWSAEPVFGDALELVVAEEERFDLRGVALEIHGLLNVESYGSRQVGGGKGPGNPHGEESELLYYVNQGDLENVKLSVKPELEILW